MRRIQRRRTKGWRMPEGAIYVGRPSVWGNPWTVRDGVSFDIPRERRAEWVISMYRRELNTFGLLSDYGWHASDGTYDRVAAEVFATTARNMAEYAPIALRGHDLACWCPLDQPCHADVLLELANR